MGHLKYEEVAMKLWPQGRRAWRNMVCRLSGVLVGIIGLPIVGGGAYMSCAPGRSHSGPIPPATDPQRATASRLRADVEMLAEEIGPRNVGVHPKALAQTEAYIRRRFEAMGYTVRRLAYQAGDTEVANLEVEVLGLTQPEEVIVVGAHYDSVPTTPGADDNASGVAGLLEIAQRLKDRPAARTMRFVAFVNEEPPYFRTVSMGSLVYAKSLKAKGDAVVAMFCLEMLGYYDSEAGSQDYPPLLKFMYPERGDYIAFVGPTSLRPFLRRSIKRFREVAAFPSEMIAAPDFVTGVDFSDHWSFAQVGYPALMVTDTAFFRNHHYHKPTDTLDRLDFDRMSRVVAGLVEVVASEAGR